MINFIEELRWRGMIHDMIPGTEEQLLKEQTSAYLGIDPTADSLHIGHLVGVMMLRHLQLAGHRPIALIGGATGMIGDPSLKSAERNLLDEETLRHNQECIKKQLSKFLDFDSDAPNAAVLVNNYDWMKDYTFLGFIRDIGKLITVNYMMAKDSVKKRLNGENSAGKPLLSSARSLLRPMVGSLARPRVAMYGLTQHVRVPTPSTSSGSTSMIPMQHATSRSSRPSLRRKSQYLKHSRLKLLTSVLFRSV